MAAATVQAHRSFRTLDRPCDRQLAGRSVVGAERAGLVADRKGSVGAWLRDLAQRRAASRRVDGHLDGLAAGASVA